MKFRSYSSYLSYFQFFVVSLDKALVALQTPSFPTSTMIEWKSSSESCKLCIVSLRYLCLWSVELYMTLMMTSAQVVETSVNVTNNRPSRDYSHPDNQTTQTTETPEFKPFTIIKFGDMFDNVSKGILSVVLSHAGSP